MRPDDAAVNEFGMIPNWPASGAGAIPAPRAGCGPLPDLAEPFLREPSGDDGKRHRQGTKTSRKSRHEGSRTPLVVAGAEREQPDIAVFLDLGQDFGHGLSFADHQFGIHVLPVANPLGEDFDTRVDALASLFQHDFGEADPVLELLRRDCRENLHAHACLGGAHCRKTHRVQAFAAVV